MKIKSKLLVLFILTAICAINAGCGNNGAAQTPSTPDELFIQWGIANLVETNVLEASVPQVAMDSNGNAIAVWVQQDQLAQRSIWANRFVPGQGWGSPVSIVAAGFVSFNASNPQVAMDPNGNAMAVWAQDDGVAASIWASRFVPGTGWSAAEVIETSDLNASNPRVAVDADGNAVSVWVQSADALPSIWANSFVPGTGWGTAVLIETSGLDAAIPKVAMSPGGEAMAVWVQSDGAAFSIWSNSGR